MEQIEAQVEETKEITSQHINTKSIFFGKGPSSMPWIQTVKGHPYFITDNGTAWTPIGQNDAITWPELKGLFRHRNLADAENYISMLVKHGVTCMRLMMEYCQGEHRYFENPVGHFNPNMVRLWDDLFLICEKHGMRILLTPYDTFWMWLRWKHHPYNKTNGGLCDKRSQWLLCQNTRAAIKRRLKFATERWGGSGALFAWDLWNEIHPAHANNSAEVFSEFVEDVGSYLRKKELHLHGRSHPQTVSVFGPVLNNNSLVADCTFRHPVLDFASVHFYESKTIDYPKNTVDAAVSMGRLTKEAIAEIKDNRPFFDSEHGPIHAFKDRRITLSDAFDNEYFRHMQWAHFASGGAGGGMRWPNRHPHSLTTGMREAQLSFANFQSIVQWHTFQRINWNEQVVVSHKALVPFGCGDKEQAIVWLLRKDTINKNGMLNAYADAITATVQLPMTEPGEYSVTLWNTSSGTAIEAFTVYHFGEEELRVQLSTIVTDLAIYVTRMNAVS